MIEDVKAVRLDEVIGNREYDQPEASWDSEVGTVEDLEASKRS